MEVLALHGSPRKRGSSEVLLDAVIEGVNSAGGTVKLFRLNRLWIQPCQNCGGCDATGECILEDDMSDLYDIVWAAQRIVVASPIFFYGVTAQTKAFIDRSQALWNRKRLMRAKGSWHDDPERKGFFLSVGATKGARLFDGAILTMKYGFDAMGLQYGGEFLVRGVEKPGDLEQMAETIKSANEFGRGIIR